MTRISRTRTRTPRTRPRTQTSDPNSAFTPTSSRTFSFSAPRFEHSIESEVYFREWVSNEEINITPEARNGEYFDENTLTVLVRLATADDDHPGDELATSEINQMLDAVDNPQIYGRIYKSEFMELMRKAENNEGLQKWRKIYNYMLRLIDQDRRSQRPPRGGKKRRTIRKHRRSKK
jgi:hypothetical protein